MESWSEVLEWSGVRFWSGKSREECSCDVCVCGQVLINLVTVMDQLHTWNTQFVVHSTERSIGAILEWSVGVESWSQIMEWQKYLLFAHKIVYSMEMTPAKFCSTNWRCSRTFRTVLELF